MDTPENPATQGTQDEGKKTKTQHNKNAVIVTIGPF